MAQAAGYIPAQQRSGAPAMKPMGPPAAKDWPKQQQQQRPGGGAPRGPPGGAPTAHPSSTSHHHKLLLPRQSKTLDERLRRDTPFMCTVRFKNDLPEIPSDPKLLVSQLDPEQLGSFFPTATEKDLRRPLLLSPDLGIPISLLDLERYSLPSLEEKPPMDEADKALLRECEGLAAGKTDASSHKLKRGNAVEVSWLMRTTYIASAEPAAEKRGGAGAKGGRGGGAAAVAAMDEEEQREKQLREIESTFEAVKRAVPAHPRNPEATPVEVLPVLPDFDKWADKLINVQYDADPGLESKQLQRVADPALRRQLVESSMLKTYKPTKEQTSEHAFMALLLPEEALEDALMGRELEPALSVQQVEGAYTWDQEYICRVEQLERSQPVNQDTYLLQLYPDRAGYAPFEARLKLNKRRRMEGDDPPPAKVHVTNRGFKPDEEQDRVARSLEWEAE